MNIYECQSCYTTYYAPQAECRWCGSCVVIWVDDDSHETDEALSRINEMRDENDAMTRDEPI